MLLSEELINRGLIKQTNNLEKIKALIDGEPFDFYIGFDPTANSLHIGHLLPLIFAKRLINAGHNGIMLLGHATASVGDPTGKNEMRKMLSHSEIGINASSFEDQISSILNNGFQIYSNMEWFSKTNFIDLIREVGPHFSINNMLRADCFKSRMERGLSFLEFNYMIMQAVDFLELHSYTGCMLQVGGDDQWSNMLAGINLINKKLGHDVFCLTLPLLINFSGQKMGKTEKGAIWLSSEKTSVFEFFQYWRNIADEDVIKCFKLLTFLPLSEINCLPFNNAKEINQAKKKLAFEITSIVHGTEKAQNALNQAEQLFSNNDIKNINGQMIIDGLSILDLIVKAKFAKSKTGARNLINGNGISINDTIINNPTISITKQEFGKEFLLKKGKKHFAKFIIEGTLNEQT